MDNQPCETRGIESYILRPTDNFDIAEALEGEMRRIGLFPLPFTHISNRLLRRPQVPNIEITLCV
ncbi:hypothetical protein D3C85_1635740 [compost metagenome]